MDIEKLIVDLLVACAGNRNNIMGAAATAPSTLQAENEKLRREVADLETTHRTEMCENGYDCVELGKVRTKLEEVKRTLAEMWFAYENKDGAAPHDFEERAVEMAQEILGPWGEECLPKYLRRGSKVERYTEKVDGIWSVSCKYEEPPYPVVTQEVIDRLAAIEDILGDKYDLDRLRELAQADREGRCVVLNMPRKPLVWGDDDQNTCLCPYCGRDLMGIPYGERMVLQCPECGQYLDVTKIITRAEAEAALREDTDEH